MKTISKLLLKKRMKINIKINLFFMLDNYVVLWITESWWPYVMFLQPWKIMKWTILKLCMMFSKSCDMFHHKLKFPNSNCLANINQIQPRPMKGGNKREKHESLTWKCDKFWLFIEIRRPQIQSAFRKNICKCNDEKRQISHIPAICW